MSQNAPVTVTAKEPIHPNLRMVAQACIDLAKIQLNEEYAWDRITAHAHKLEPTILAGERFGREALILNGKPIIVLYRGSVACRLVGKYAEWLVRNDKAIWWRIPGEKVARADWVLLNHNLPLSEIIDWAEKAVVQAGVGVNT